MRAEFNLRLKCDEFDESKLQSLTRDLARSLQEQKLGIIDLQTESSKAGEKGDPVTTGNIILALIGSGGVAVSLVEVLKTYIERKRTIHYEISRSDGKRIALSAENLRDNELQATSKVLEEFLRG